VIPKGAIEVGGNPKKKKKKKKKKKNKPTSKTVFAALYIGDL